jgi:chemotaxis protein histidine kinase CheA
MSDLEIVKEFLVESYENLDRLDRELVALEKDPTNRDTLASVFRTIHTIKGTSGFLAFNKLGAVAHVGESLLARLRDGHLALNPEITTALLAMVDAVRQILGSIEALGNEGDRNYDRLIATLTELLQSDPSQDASPFLNSIHLPIVLSLIASSGGRHHSFRRSTFMEEPQDRINSIKDGASRCQGQCLLFSLGMAIQ